MAAELFVPGRLCLFGEHSDWAAGYRSTHADIAPGHCLVAGTEQGLRSKVERAEGWLEITSELPDGSRQATRIETSREVLEKAATGSGFFSYAAGTFLELRQRHAHVEGLRLTVRSTLPVQKGLSSSAAICVLVARAASEVYGLGLAVESEMDVAYAGERRTGSKCGRMDQICAFGSGPVAMHVDGDSLRFEPVEPGGRFDLLVVDLCRGKDTRRILSDLNRCFPDTEGDVARGVREALGQRNRETLRGAEAHVRAGDARALGELMTAAQRRFDELVAPACPELLAPRLHEVLDHPAVAAMGWGGKGVGSQGDGSAQIVARGPEERDALASRLESELGVRCLPLSFGARARG